MRRAVPGVQENIWIPWSLKAASWVHSKMDFCRTMLAIRQAKHLLPLVPEEPLCVTCEPRKTIQRLTMILSNDEGALRSWGCFCNFHDANPGHQVRIVSLECRTTRTHRSQVGVIPEAVSVIHIRRPITLVTVWHCYRLGKPVEALPKRTIEMSDQLRGSIDG